MKTSAEIIPEIENEIVRLKSKNRTHYYSFRTEISLQTANEIKKHFSGYSVEIKQCPLKNWDIIVSW